MQFRHRCKEASQHIVNALDSDKSGASRSRWPLTGGGGEFREEEGRGNAGAMQQMRHIPFPMSLVELHQNRDIDHWRMVTPLPLLQKHARSRGSLLAQRGALTAGMFLRLWSGHMLRDLPGVGRARAPALHVELHEGGRT